VTQVTYTEDCALVDLQDKIEPIHADFYKLPLYNGDLAVRMERPDEALIEGHPKSGQLVNVVALRRKGNGTSA
jgi:hypothetical protein